MRFIARLIGALGAVVLLGLTPAWGVTKSWNSSRSGEFHDPLQWTPTGAPMSTDVAEFQRGKAAIYTVTFPEDVGKAGRRTDRLVVGTNNVTFAQGKAGDSTYDILNATTTPAGRGIVIGEQSGDVAGLTTSLASLTAVAATIGDEAGSSGGFTVASGAVEFTAALADEPLIVGNYGAGVLTVAEDASLTAARILVGKEVGSSGVVTIDGGTLNGFIDMASGLGAKTLTLNGISKTTSLHVAGADAVANINGSVLDGGQLGSFTAGNGGRINQSGGTLKNGSIGPTFIDGHLRVTGSNSRYESASALSLSGASTLEVANGGRVIPLGLFVGSESLVSGSGSIETNTLYYSGYSNSGRLAPGAEAGSGLGTLNILGDFTQTAPGRLEIGIAAGSSGPVYDRVTFRNDVLINGAIEVTLIDGFEPVGGQSFSIFQYTNGTIHGIGATLVLPDLAFGRQWDSSTLSGQGILSVVGVGELPADFQGDDDVDGDDLTLWRLGFGALGTPSQAQGNADGDQDVDGQDFLYWQQQFGSGVAVAAAGDAVPEPTTSALAVAGALLAMRRRRGLTA